jgi:hypothetical protein
MDTTQIIGLKGGQDATWFCVLVEEWRGVTKYYPAIRDGKEVSCFEFASIEDYMAHKVEHERETIRLVIAGNPIAAEDAISVALGCKALATGPSTVDVFPGQRIE